MLRFVSVPAAAILITPLPAGRSAARLAVLIGFGAEIGIILACIPFSTQAQCEMALTVR